MITKLQNKTPGGTQNILLQIEQVPLDTVLQCCEEERIRSLCKDGCANYGNKWCCPPFSAKFSHIASRYTKAVVILGTIQLQDMHYIKQPYQKVKAANMVLKSKTERIARFFETQLDGLALLSGSCNLCKPCKKKQGLPCGHSKMRYSLESTGINVQTLIKTTCNVTLQWYQKGMQQDYTSTVTLVLCHEKMPPNTLESLWNQYQEILG